MADSPISGRGLTIRELFTGRRFRLDFYQREYTWSRKAVAALLDDLHRRFAASWNDLDEREATDKYAPYFLGPFVYHEQDGITYLVDGQQRITTLHLLLIHLRRLLLDQERDAEAEQLGQLICSVRHGRPTFAIDDPERAPLLQALNNGEPYQLPDEKSSVSLRNLWERNQDLAEDFPAILGGDALPVLCQYSYRAAELPFILATRVLPLALSDLCSGCRLADAAGSQRRLQRSGNPRTSA